MTQIDIWLSVLEEDGYEVYDELTSRNGKNKIELRKSIEGRYEYMLPNYDKAEIWFDYDSGEVTHFTITSNIRMIDSPKISKEEYYEGLKDKFRKYKIKSLDI